ncbi:unnamed protein product [Auanema sp. JU1783]|nr:unnamed protein product [Auanema sp. JU1783]
MIKSRSLTFHFPASNRIVHSKSIEEIRELIHSTRSSHWEPPWASWKCRQGLPYGWEMAKDRYGHKYFIDHINRLTTYKDPRNTVAPEGRRDVEIQRRKDIGFGFVAAGQQPTIIQFVSPEGPSEGLLYANDQILCVNQVDVSNETKEQVVEMVRNSLETVTLTVQQLPPRPSKSARRQCKVRFTDRVIVASRPDSPSDFPPSIPNVLRVFLENGQTRSFKYNPETTVKMILTALVSKLQFRSSRFFALALEYSLGARTSRISLLRLETRIETLMSLPNSSHLRCVLRFAFVPKEIHTVLQEDPNAFEYIYQQSINDVIRGRFAFEMRYEACVRLAALHMQQVAIDSGILKEGKVSISKIEKDYGLETFLPSILLDNVKRREIRKHIRFYLKRDSSKLAECLSKSGKQEDGLPPCTSEDVGLMLRLKYLHIIAHLPSFGGRGFSVTFRESQIEMIMQIDPKNGLLVRHPGKSGQPAISIGFDLIGKLVVRDESEVTSLISIRLANNVQQGLEFIVEKDDVDDLLSYLAGYHEVHERLPLTIEVDSRPPTPPLPPNTPPPYTAVHTVISAGWNYAVPEGVERSFDLRDEPPPYQSANAVLENGHKLEEKKLIPLVDLPNVTSAREESIERQSSSRRNSSDSRRLLKATDSLLIKNSRELQKKEMASPMLRRPSNPAGIKEDAISDSSDTEDSSWSSPMRSPLSTDRNNLDILLEAVELTPPIDIAARRASIETLIQAAPDQANNLENLILNYPEISADLSSTSPELKVNGSVCRMNGKLMNGNLPHSLSAFDDVRLIDDDSSITEI